MGQNLRYPFYDGFWQEIQWGFWKSGGFLAETNRFRAMAQNPSILRIHPLSATCFWTDRIQSIFPMLKRVSPIIPPSFMRIRRYRFWTPINHGVKNVIVLNCFETLPDHRKWSPENGKIYPGPIGRLELLQSKLQVDLFRIKDPKRNWWTCNFDCRSFSGRIEAVPGFLEKGKM